MRLAVGSAWLVGAGVLTIAACTGGPTLGSASVHGTIGGETIATTDAYATNTPFGTGSQTITIVDVSITNLAGICAAVQSGNKSPNLNTLSLALTVSGSAAVMADRYTVGESGSASLGAAYRKTDENCAGSLPSLATAGSVTFSEIDSSTIRGTFDLTFTNDHVTGDFTAPVCDTGNVPPSLTCTH